MSVRKLLSRIVSAEHVEDGKDLHQNAYGITSDPLTQFAIVLSALIHDGKTGKGIQVQISVH